MLASLQQFPTTSAAKIVYADQPAKREYYRTPAGSTSAEEDEDLE